MQKYSNRVSARRNTKKKNNLWENNKGGRKKERDIKIAIDTGQFVENDKMTVGEWADEWLKIYKQNVGYNTLQRYKAIINNQIKPLIGFYNLTDLKINIVQITLNRLSEIYSTSTLKKFKITLNQIYESAIKMQLVYKNPCNGVIIPQKEQPKRTSIPDETIKYIEEFCRGYKNGSFILTLLYTGLRRGEAIALTWNDIDLKNSCIHVNKAIEFINNRPKIKSPKTANGIREVPLLDMLKPYLTKPKDAEPNDYVFKNNHGALHTLVSIRRLYESFIKNFKLYMKEKYKNINIDYNFTMHQFRHTYATILYKAGVDVKTAQSYLGHGSISVTMDIYTHLDKQHKKLNAERLNEFISNAAV